MPNNIQNWDMAYAMTFAAVNTKLKNNFQKQSWNAIQGTDTIDCTTTEGWSFMMGGDSDKVKIKITFTCNYNITTDDGKHTTGTGTATASPTIQLDLKWLKQAIKKETEINTNHHIALIDFTIGITDDSLITKIKNLFSTIIDNTKAETDSKVFLKDLYDTFESLNIFKTLGKTEGFKWMNPTTVAYTALDSNDLEPKLEDSVFGILCMTDGRKNKEKPIIDVNIIPNGLDTAIIITPELLMQHILKPTIQTLFKDGTFETEGNTFINTKKMYFVKPFTNIAKDNINPEIKEKGFICRLDNNSLVLNFEEMTYEWPYSRVNDNGSVLLQRKCKGNFGKKAVSKLPYMQLDSSTVKPNLKNRVVHRMLARTALNYAPLIVSEVYEWWRNRKEEKRFADLLVEKKDNLEGKYIFAEVDAFRIYRIYQYDKTKNTWLTQLIDYKFEKNRMGVYCVLNNTKEIFILKINEDNKQYSGFELVSYIKRAGTLRMEDDGGLWNALESPTHLTNLMRSNEPSWMNLNKKLLQSIRNILSDLIFNVPADAAFDLEENTFATRLYEQKAHLQNKTIATGDNAFKITNIYHVTNNGNVTIYISLRSSREMIGADDNSEQTFNLEINDNYAQYGGFKFNGYQTMNEVPLKEELKKAWMNLYQPQLLQIREVLNHWISLDLDKTKGFDFQKRMEDRVTTDFLSKEILNINLKGTIKTENFELTIKKVYANGGNVFVILRETVPQLEVFRKNINDDAIVLKVEKIATTSGYLTFHKYIKDKDLSKINSVLSLNAGVNLDEVSNVNQWNNLYRNDLVQIKDYLMEQLKIPVFMDLHPYLKLALKGGLDAIVPAFTRNVASDVLANGDIVGLETEIDKVLETIQWPGATGQQLTLTEMDLNGNFRLSFHSLLKLLKGVIEKENQDQLIYTFPSYNAGHTVSIENTGNVDLTFHLENNLLVEVEVKAKAVENEYKLSAFGTGTKLYVKAKSKPALPTTVASYTVFIKEI